MTPDPALPADPAAPDPPDLDDLLARAADPAVPPLARELAAVVVAQRAELEQGDDRQREQTIRADERRRLADLLESNEQVIVSFLGSEGLSIQLLVFLLRLGT